MSTRGRILLHVGVQKTGSTYLQIRMRTHLDALRAQGVYVPFLAVAAPLMGNAKLLATVLSGEPSYAFRHVFPQIDVASLDPAAVVADLLAGWRPERETLVLSAEIFRPEHAARLRALLPPWATVDVVLFVRRQDVWIESYYRQLVKVGEVRGGIDGFVAAVLARASAGLCYPDWLMHRDAWLAAFENCSVVLFDEAKRDLFAALFAAAKHAVPAGIPDIPPQQVALDLHQVAYLTALDPSLAYAGYMRRRAATVAASARLGAPAPGSLLSAADRSRVQSMFADSNRRLLESLGRSPAALGGSNGVAPPVALRDVLASEAFERHARVADSIYAEAAVT